MDVTFLYICVGWLLIGLGLIGCVLPILPGPPLAFCALLIARFLVGKGEPSFMILGIALGATVLVTVADYVIPIFGAKVFKCSTSGIRGAIFGTLVGCFFLPIGIIVGPFVGAMIGEISVGKRTGKALFGAFGALLGFICGTLMKLFCCGWIGYWYYLAV